MIMVHYLDLSGIPADKLNAPTCCNVNIAASFCSACNIHPWKKPTDVTGQVITASALVPPSLVGQHPRHCTRTEGARLHHARSGNKRWISPGLPFRRDKQLVGRSRRRPRHAFEFRAEDRQAELVQGWPESWLPLWLCICDAPSKYPSPKLDQQVLERGVL